MANTIPVIPVKEASSMKNKKWTKSLLAVLLATVILSCVLLSAGADRIDAAEIDAIINTTTNPANVVIIACSSRPERIST